MMSTLDEARWLADNDALPVQQGSPEWFAMRCGKVTASRIADVMANPREPGKGMRVKYMWQIVTERDTGRPMKTYQSKTMLEAHEWEPLARAAYTYRTDNAVEQIAFVDHLDIPMTGCSPDGLVGSDGLVELKCPELTAHYDALLKEVIPGEYFKQMQFQMACTGRRWCDYVSFNADLSERRKTKIIRVDRDSTAISAMEAEVRSFQTQVDLALSALKEKLG